MAGMGFKSIVLLAALLVLTLATARSIEGVTLSKILHEDVRGVSH